MARAATIGSGPIAFFTSDGQQVSIPLSDIVFDGDTPTSMSFSLAGLNEWLAYLFAQRRIARAPAPPPGAAMIVKAAVAGSTGNNIVVTATKRPGEAAKIDVTVSETDIYDGLTLDSHSDNYIVNVLGGTSAVDASPVLGTRPGLVRVKSLGGEPSAGSTINVTGGDPWTIGSADSTWFTLQPRPGGGTGGSWALSVKNRQQVSGGSSTFTLVVQWTRTVTIAKPDDLGQLGASLSFVVTILQPDGGYKLPALGGVTLRGGAEAVGAAQAMAVFPASA